MKKIISYFLLAIFANAGIHPVLAITSTPSATPNQELQDKIKSLVKENLETTESIIQKDVVLKSLVGYSGKVKSVGSKNITLEVDQDLLQVAVTASTTITKLGTEIKTTSIALADKLIVIGQKTKDNVLEAKTISVISEPNPETIVTTKAEIATIKNIDLKKKTFTLVINSQDLSFTLSRKSTVKLENFTDGDQIFAITKKYQGKNSLSRAIKI